MDFDDIGMFFLGGIMVVMMIMLLLLFVVRIPLIIYDSMGEECSFRSNSILKSVNSIEDINNGLLSSGTMKETTLLFSGGLVAKFQPYDLNDIELVIGRKYRINKCINNGERISYEIKRYALQEKAE